MELKLVMVMVHLFDVCTVSTGDIPHLIIIEQPGEVNEKETFMETTWHDYTYSLKVDDWIKGTSTVYSIPYSHTISTVMRNGEWLALVEANMKDALYLFSPVKDKKEPNYIPVNLSSTSWRKIELPPSGEWSTLSLPTRKHLFNPQVLPAGESRTLILANAADASARFFIADTSEVEVANIERCFEPRLVFCGEKKIVFSRRSPVGWSVFFNQPTTRTTPQLLPLFTYSLDQNYTVVDSLNLSKGWHTGPSFGFDVCATGDDALILASISGLLKKPYLHIVQSHDYGESWKELAMIPLDSVPQQVRVAVAGSRLLTACTFKKHDGYHVMAAEFDR